MSTLWMVLSDFDVLSCLGAEDSMRPAKVIDVLLFFEMLFLEAFWDDLKSYVSLASSTLLSLAGLSFICLVEF